MPPARNGRDLRAYRRKAARLRRTAPPICAWCSKPIDLTLDARDPWSWTADHKDALANGGHVLGPLQPMHRRCNTSKGIRDTEPPERPTSRPW
jgi:hypothetical protein